MTQSKIKAMQTALLKYNQLARRLLAPDQRDDFTYGDKTEMQGCLRRGEEALKVEVSGRS